MQYIFQNILELITIYEFNYMQNLAISVIISSNFGSMNLASRKLVLKVSCIHHPAERSWILEHFNCTTKRADFHMYGATKPNRAVQASHMHFQTKSINNLILGACAIKDHKTKSKPVLDVKPR